MDLNLYRRHKPTCKFANKGSGYTKCTCPIWCDGKLGGKRFRRSVGLSDWGRAVRRVERWEEKPEEILGGGPTIRKCCDAFLDDCRARKLAPSTLASYTKTLNHFAGHCDSAGVSYITELRQESIAAFRAQRAVAPSTQSKELETIRSFLRFGVHRKWIIENPAKGLKPPIEHRVPTLPFTADEVTKIIAACDRIENNNRPSAERARPRARALVLLLLYSGLRISDAVKLERAKLNVETGQLMIRVMKTKVPLYIRLGNDALDALKALPVKSPYFFWTGQSKLSTAVGSARRTIECVMKLADIKGHPHMFRDTFAVTMLQKGVDLRTVQLLLGHESIKTTEKHYAPFVAGFQKMLDAATAMLDFGHEVRSR